jgi:hypothetical protein
MCSVQLDTRAPVAVQVLPHNEHLYCSHLQARKSVLHAENKLAGVLTDLIEKARNEAFFLQQGDRGSAGATCQQVLVHSCRRASCCYAHEF